MGCQQIINLGFPTMVCTDCNKWIHKRCVSISWVKAVENKHIFKCKNCEEKDDETTEDDIEIVEDVEKHPESKKRKLGVNEGETDKNRDKSSGSSVDSNASNGKRCDIDKGKSGSAPAVPAAQSASQQIDTLRLNLSELSWFSWLQDSHIQIAIEDIVRYGENGCGSNLYFVPSLSHFIKLGSQEDVEVQLGQSDAISKRHIIFMVNNCDDKLGTREGTHWSLLVYKRSRNTWYHVDSGGNANASHAKQIMEKVNKYLSNHGNLVGAKTNYVESSCTQQRNGYDCGPLAILFAKEITTKIARGKSLHTCWVDEYETREVRERIKTQLTNRLRYLEKGEGRTSDKMNHRDRYKKRNTVCWFYKYKECKSGKKCSYWHPPDMRQKERDRYSDVSFKSRDHGRTVNDRNNSEQGPYYRSRRDHADGHRGLRGHQYPQKIYSNEKQNQNTRFLGYRQNPNHGLTSTEERLLRLLRECIQTETGGRFPARR